MAAISRLQSSSCATPVLDIFMSVSGVLMDVYSLEYQIWDATGTPTQVFPTTPGDRVPVDVDEDCPAGGRLGLGHYVAEWTVPIDEAIGTHQIRWFLKLTNSTPEQTYVEEFEVLPEVLISGYSPQEHYVSVAEMREEGVPNSVTDSFLLKRISLASRFVEASTRRFFYPRELTIRLDGTGGPKLFLNDPIIAIEYVKFETSPLYPDDFSSVEADIIRVYNRHLSQGLLEPDDRNNPKLELFNPGFVRERRNSLLTKLNFPVGQQNVEIKGVFGYTDPDPLNPQGKTPDMIKHATKLLVMREVSKLTNTGDRAEARNRWRVQSETTRDQSYSLEGIGALKLVPGNGFTGDPEIDNILAYFQRPPAMGAA